MQVIGGDQKVTRFLAFLSVQIDARSDT